MRILVLTPTFLPAVGGAELVILEVYRRIATRHTVLVLTPYLSKTLLKTRGSSEYDHLVNFDVQHYTDNFTFMKIRGHRLTGGLIPPFSLSAVSAIKQATNAFRPDVINVHYVMPTGLAGLFAQRVLNVPTVITYNGRDVPGPGIPTLWKYWHRGIGLSCADMTFVSRYCRDVIYGPTSQVGHIIHNGVGEPTLVTPEHTFSFKSRLQIMEDEYVLLSLQRLDYLKRIDIILRSMPEILAQQPKTRLIIAGKGTDLSRLKSIAAELGLADQVIFPGFVDESEKPFYFTAADLFLFHSTYETFGIVLAEAMNYGTPIVSVANTAIPEVVDEGETGVLVPTLDHRAFANAVLQLLSERERRKKMGKKAKEKAKRIFTWDTNARKYEEVLESAAAK